MAAKSLQFTIWFNVSHGRSLLIRVHIQIVSLYAMNSGARKGNIAPCDMVLFRHRLRRHLRHKDGRQQLHVRASLWLCHARVPVLKSLCLRGLLLYFAIVTNLISRTSHHSC